MRRAFRGMNRRRLRHRDLRTPARNRSLESRHSPDHVRGDAGIAPLDHPHVLVAQPKPERELLLLDILALSTHEPRKALDVFARRVSARAVHSEVRDRGGAPATKR